ncbi:hypothetical protein H0E87_020618 [Populus deltoides]|uniref:Uncharacterized protein n=1 Tax=Populus deltoides TaxID=3696 RepID=A0A8T2XLB9_POPDE|nr:hypothetical protein H0E87_020618 [Populus deltoides]
MLVTTYNSLGRRILTFMFSAEKPDRGVYGPILSAISVFSDLKVCSSGKKKGIVYVVVGAVGASCLVAIILMSKGLDFPKGTFSLKQIRAATNDICTCSVS